MESYTAHIEFKSVLVLEFDCVILEVTEFKVLVLKAVVQNVNNLQDHVLFHGHVVPLESLLVCSRLHPFEVADDLAVVLVYCLGFSMYVIASVER